MAEKITITDVGPRDGLQNQARILTPGQRLQLINALINAGLGAVEIGSFVSPKAVPAMAGTDEIARSLPKGATKFCAFVPNRKGYDLAKANGVRSVGMAIAATEGMNQNNIRMSTEQAMAMAAEVIQQGALDNIETVPYIATAWECPYEGLVAPKTTLDLTARLLANGASKVVLADTIGAASPAQVASLLGQAVAEFGADRLGCHFHDTRGFGVANAYAAAVAGIRYFDASIGGLGGCPFAPGATGNVATEDLAVLFKQMGFDTGINLPALLDAVALAQELTGNCDGGSALRWLKRQREKGSL